MVENPEKLSTICLQHFVCYLKYSQRIWKKRIEQCIEKLNQEKNRLLLNEQRKRKHHRSDDDSISNVIDLKLYETELKSHDQLTFIEQFLHGICPLNFILSERLADCLVKQNQLNDYTLTLFSSNVTCLKRLTLNIQHITRLQCHILNQHSTLIELKVLFKDVHFHQSNNTINDLFYQHICPSMHSKIDDIYKVYGSLILYYLNSCKQNESLKVLSTTRYSSQRSFILSEGFSPQKLFNAILNNLNSLTFERLKILNISHCKFFAACHSTSTRKSSFVDMSPLTKCSSNSTSITTSSVDILPTNLRLILKFKNLTSLNVSHTDIKSYCLDYIIDSLKKLNHLDISSCRTLTSFNALLKLSTNLKSLNLYNCSFQQQENPSIYKILYELKSLEYLDISTDHNSPLIDYEYDINRFLLEDNCLIRLQYFDISGQKQILSKSLYKFLLSHPNLQFLGLFLTSEKYFNCLFDKNDLCYSKTRLYTCDLQDIVSLNVTDDDIQQYEIYLIEALKRYSERTNFVPRILYCIFFLTRSYQTKHQYLLIELILHTMIIHSNLQSVQMASTACIYNLTRTPLTEQINVKCLGKIVQAIINVMEIFPTQQQLQKNCLLTLCSDRILHEPNFDFYLLARLVMNNLQNYTDLAIIQPGVAVLALLTTRLTVDECTQLGSIANVQRILQLIEQQIDRLQTIHLIQTQQHINEQAQNEINDINNLLNHTQQLTSDDTLRFSLSLLWNLTDENPIVCERFIHSMGLQLFQRLMNLFSSDIIVLTKIVGLLSNISEVSHLIVYLYSIDIIPLMERFLSEGIIDIAFSAAGILAHLLFEQINHEVNIELCQYMRNAIIKWQNPDRNMVTYRSFKPFIPLLHCTQIPVIQLWAIWAIHHVCSTDRARYIRIIREEKLYDLMQKLYNDQISSKQSDRFLIDLLSSILNLLKPYRPYSHKN